MPPTASTAPITPDAALAIIRLHMKRCPGCGYDLRSTHTVVCPECGRDLTTAAANWRPVSAEVDSRRRLGALGASLAPNIAVFLWLLLDGLTHANQNALWAVPTFLFVAASTPVAGIWHWLFLERRSRASGRAANWSVGIIAAWVWPALFIVWLLVA